MEKMHFKIFLKQKQRSVKGTKLTVMEIHCCAYSAFLFVLRLQGWKMNALGTAQRPNLFHINCQIDSGSTYATSCNSVFLHPHLSLLTILTGSQIWIQSNLIQAIAPSFQSQCSLFLHFGLVWVFWLVGLGFLIISTH